MEKKLALDPHFSEQGGVQYFSPKKHRFFIMRKKTSRLFGVIWLLDNNDFVNDFIEQYEKNINCPGPKSIFQRGGRIF